MYCTAFYLLGLVCFSKIDRVSAGGRAKKILRQDYERGITDAGDQFFRILKKNLGAILPDLARTSTQIELLDEKSNFRGAKIFWPK